MIIPGFLIAWITFPGVIVHELAHQLFCRWQGLAVLEVKYFQFGNPAGYVLHEVPPYAGQTFWIAAGPMVVNTVAGAIIAAPAMLACLTFGAGSPLDYLLLWLGVSIAMHSFPSTQDTKGIWSALGRDNTSVGLKLVGYPVCVLFFIGAVGSVVWLDLLYGVGVCMLVPMLLSNVGL
jgi:hypothetical protein